jgi:hypothetical protein
VSVLFGGILLKDDHKMRGDILKITLRLQKYNLHNQIRTPDKSRLAVQLRFASCLDARLYVTNRLQQVNL